MIVTMIYDSIVDGCKPYQYRVSLLSC